MPDQPRAGGGHATLLLAEHIQPVARHGPARLGRVRQGGVQPERRGPAHDGVRIDRGHGARRRVPGRRERRGVERAHGHMQRGGGGLGRCGGGGHGPSRIRDECLNINSFYSLLHAQVIIGDWKDEYNHHRRHSSLGYLTPAEYARQCTHQMETDDSQNVRTE
ncbi:hypothetical protein MICRO80W_80068 [Micrococcus luteus]|nr:hypothetical protein MICRO80W_80068 [Micrococcus luteus]